MDETLRAQILRLCAANRFPLENGIQLKEFDRDRAVMEMTVDSRHLNPLGFVHGGALYSMADSAAGVAARTDGRQYVTLTSSLNFLRSATLGEHLEALGVARRRGKTTVFLSVDITNQDGTLLASGTYTFYCLGEIKPGQA